jgi:hypothetical protein
MNDRESTTVKLAAPRTSASRMSEPRVREELGRCRATAGKLTDSGLAETALAMVQRLEDAIDEVIRAAHADGTASDIGTGRLEEAATRAATAALHEAIAAFAHERLIPSGDLAAHELVPRLLIVHAELQRLAMYVRFEQAGRQYTDALRRQTSGKALLVIELARRAMSGDQPA